MVGVVYRPPNTDIDMFNDQLSDNLTQINKQNKTCFCFGEYNIDLLNCSLHPPSQSFIDNMFTNYFIPLINKPIRVTNRSATLIDNIFRNNTNVSDRSIQGFIYTDISDHFPVFYINNSIVESTKPNIFIKQQMSQANIDHFKTKLQGTNWDDILNMDNPQESFPVFHSRYTKLYSDCFPKKEIRSRYNNRKSWLTEGPKSSIKHKNKLFVKQIKIEK